MQERQKRLEATPAQMIEQLEIRRTDIVRKKNALEKKINELAVRNKKKQELGKATTGQIK